MSAPIYRPGATTASVTAEAAARAAADALLAPIASPTFTGTAAAPTAAATDSSTTLANTAFVWAHLPIAHLADSTATGGNARGANAVDFQTSRTAASRVASGARAFLGGGTENTSSGTDCVCVGGNGNTVSAQASFCGGGISNTLDGTLAWTPGGQRAASRSTYGRGAWSSGLFAAQGDAQAGEFVLRKATTDATIGRLTADGLTASTVNTVQLPNSGAYMVRLLVVARQSGGAAGTAGDSAGWTVDALVKRGANAAATSLVGGGGASVAPTYNDAAAAAWRLTIAADTTNGGIAVSGTGEASKSISWVARVLSVEVSG